MAWQVAIAQEAELRRELEARGYELQRVQGCSTIEQCPVLIPALMPALDEMRGELRAAEERCRAESERARRAELRAAIEAERCEQAEQLLEREQAVRQVLEERHAEALQVHAATHATRTPRARHASTPRMCLRTATLCTTTLCAAAGAARGRGTGAAQCDGRGEARAGAGTRRGRTAGGGT